ncbi:hypothetical protein FB451DRAFT_1367078 [Mycena latifolia]|nr:hypothetical protein FB451DRAFT_1367078 [Mycena latifolia]
MYFINSSAQNISDVLRTSSRLIFLDSGTLIPPIVTSLIRGRPEIKFRPSLLEVTLFGGESNVRSRLGMQNVLRNIRFSNHINHMSDWLRIPVLFLHSSFPRFNRKGMHRPWKSGWLWAASKKLDLTAIAECFRAFGYISNTYTGCARRAPTQTTRATPDAGQAERGRQCVPPRADGVHPASAPLRLGGSTLPLRIALASYSDSRPQTHTQTYTQSARAGTPANARASLRVRHAAATRGCVAEEDGARVLVRADEDRARPRPRRQGGGESTQVRVLKSKEGGGRA